MSSGALGKVFEDGEVVMRQGEIGECMFVIQEGKVGVYLERDGAEILVAEPSSGEMIGEMAIFERQPRSATVRAKGQAKILTVDRRNFLRRVQEDPSLAFRILETLSHRVRDLNEEVGRLRSEDYGFRFYGLKLAQHRSKRFELGRFDQVASSKQLFDGRLCFVSLAEDLSFRLGCPFPNDRLW